MSDATNKTIVVALGGNAIISAKQKGTYEEQFENVRNTTQHLAKLVQSGYTLVVTHGNGPQVGNLLIQHAAAVEKVPALPMDVCGAQSQGQIGYMIQQTLRENLVELGLEKEVATLVTQTQVDSADPAFSNPTKPVGPFYDAAWAEQAKAKGFAVVEDSGRGYRRVVPSPNPTHIVEINSIRKLIAADALVIASGGGGIPVVKKGNGYAGVEAVIDKDLAGELLSSELKASGFIVLTDVEKAALNYRQPNQVDLGQITLTEAKKYAAEGHFAKGSMGPKVAACIRFIEHGGEFALITHPSKVLEALRGDTGTRIVAD